MNTDIFGANLYHRHLKRHRTGRSNGIASVVAGRGAQTSQLDMDEEESSPCAEECHGILVQVVHLNNYDIIIFSNVAGDDINGLNDNGRRGFPDHRQELT